MLELEDRDRLLTPQDHQLDAYLTFGLSLE